MTDELSNVCLGHKIIKLNCNVIARSPAERDKLRDEAIPGMQNKVLLNGGYPGRIASLRSQWHSRLADFSSADDRDDNRNLFKQCWKIIPLKKDLQNQNKEF